ncbi:spore germination protein (amino acid permease) [Paenibacillus anaericanus]|uniref:GerAB/ArcD/ProY family transporter n=1 Tax=Paenibacillus anaericanus TaxID=170367 RepID=UPI00277F3345|nr:endospore germination permease [Paenibacillus anaericanus]MDQ0088878.1 spore germination protein (amino acid permease) [Paenibacillus anaericanus]
MRKIRTNISFFQAVMIIMLSTGLMNHVIIIPLMLDAAKRDAWISVLLAGACALVWISILHIGSTKMNKQHLFAWLAKAYHPIVGRTLAAVASVYLFVICTLTTRDTVYWVHLTFSPETPILVLTLILLMISAVNAFLGIHSLANTAGVLLPFVILLGYFVMFSNTPHKDYSLLKPILEHGMQPVWDGSLFVGAGLVEVIMLVFLQHHIRSRLSYISFAIMILLLVGLTMGPIIGAIVEFGPDEADKLRFPAYEEWRLLSIGRYIEHLDFFSVYQWFSGAFLRISLTMFLILDIFQIQSKKVKVLVLTCISSAITVFTAIPFSDQFILKMMSAYILPFSLWGVLFFSMIIAGLILASRKGKVTT